MLLGAGLDPARWAVADHVLHRDLDPDRKLQEPLARRPHLSVGAFRPRRQSPHLLQEHVRGWTRRTSGASARSCASPPGDLSGRYLEESVSDELPTPLTAELVDWLRVEKDVEAEDRDMRPAEAGACPAVAENATPAVAENAALPPSPPDTDEISSASKVRNSESSEKESCRMVHLRGR